MHYAGCTAHNEENCEKSKNNYYLWMLKASQEGTTPLYLKKLHDLKMIFRPFGAKKIKKNVYGK